MEKLTKYLFIWQISCFSLLTGSNAVADDGAPTQSTITAQLEALEKSLGLSADQIAKVQPIILDNIQQREAVMADFGLGKSDGASAWQSGRTPSTLMARIRASVRNA